MIPEEANKIIAEYMGKAEVYTGDIFMGYTNMRAGQLFTESLDALIPVWKKLDEFPRLEYTDYNNRFYCYMKWVSAIGETMQEAAGFATAKAILELSVD